MTTYNSNEPIYSSLVEDDEEFVDLVEEFVQGLGERMEGIERALTEHDFATLKTLAHQLKGSAGGYGYDILTEKAAELEERALQQEIIASQQAVDALQGIVSRVVVRPQ